MKILMVLCILCVYSLVSMQRIVRVVPPSVNYKYQLDYYERVLKNVPGAKKIITLLRCMYDRGDFENMRGHLFELEVATKFHAGGVHVEGLNCTPASNPSCEFDVMTKKLAIECKDSAMNKKKLTRLFAQFSRQHKVAKALGKTYAVCFKRPIKLKILKWLRKHEIMCVRAYD